jgi:peptide/nickel transport system substrate-binding protein
MKITAPRYWSAVLFAGALALAAGCSSGSGTAASSGSSSSGSSSSGSVNPSQTFIAAYKNPQTTWDPALDPATFTWQYYDTQTYDKLINLNPDGSLAPMLATSWTESADEKTITLKLRTDVTFQDGSKFNADVAVANLKRYQTVGTPGAAALADVASVTASGPDTVAITLKQANSSFLYTLTTRDGFVVSLKGIANPSALKSAPAGSGPYKLVSNDGQKVVLQRWDGYWDKSTTFPQQKILYAITDDTARLNALRSGQVDFINLDSDFTEADTLAEGGGYKVYQVPSTRTVALNLNLKNPALAKPQVRQAMSLAIDRAAFSQTLMQGASCPTTVQPFPKGMPGYDASLTPTYDLTKAKQLMAQAGVSHLTLATVEQSDNPYAVNEAVAFQSELAQIGITLKFVPAAAVQARAIWRSGKYDAFVGDFVAANTSPSSVVASYLGPDAPDGPDPKVAALDQQAVALPVASAQQTADFQSIAQEIATNPYYIYVCSYPSFFIMKSNVVNASKVLGAQISAAVDTRFLGLS